MSARHMRTMTQPGGEAFLQRDDSGVQNMLQRDADTRTSEAEVQDVQGERIQRMDAEMDGVTARVRRGCVPIETGEHDGTTEVARAVFAGEPTLRETWATLITEQRAEGKVEEVIAAIQRLPPMAPEPGTSRRIRDSEADAFRTKTERMRSPARRAEGMPVDRGIAEAAWTVVVATRATCAGIRWTPDGLDAVLALHTSVLNGSFDQCWHDVHETA